MENSPERESMPTPCRPATSPAEATISEWIVTAIIKQLLHLPTGGTSAFGGFKKKKRKDKEMKEICNHFCIICDVILYIGNFNILN